MNKITFNQRGSALTLMLILMPILLSAMALVAAGFLVIRAQKQADYTCRSQLLVAQAHMLEQMQKLRSLNPAATELRIERAAAEAEVKAAAGYPPALAIAIPHLNSVILRQEALSTTQQTFITMANFNAINDVHSASAQIRSNSIQGSLQIQNSSAPKLSVRADPPEDITPDYEPTNDISSKQVMWLTWKFQPTKILPEWLKQILNPPNIALPSECSSIPQQNSKQGAKKWIASLSRVKPSLN